MKDEIGNNAQEIDAAADESNRIRKQRIDDLMQLCHRIGAEAKARGLTEEILNQILSEQPTEEEAAQNRIRAQKLLGVIAEPRNRPPR